MNMRMVLLEVKVIEIINSKKGHITGEHGHLSMMIKKSDLIFFHIILKRLFSVQDYN